MRIIEIYEHFDIPEKLQLHMLTVAAVGKYILDNWEGPDVDTPTVIAALLVHDLGNLVKFDLSENAPIIDPSLHTDDWRQKQAAMHVKYGKHSHTTTEAMLHELGVDKKIITLAGSVDAADLCRIAQNSLEKQICEYADLRVTPTGITALDERLADLRKRYKEKYPKWKDDQAFARNNHCASRIENLLQQYTSVDITDIPDETIKAYLVELAQFEIPTE